MKKENSKTVPTKRMPLKKIVAILGITLTAVLAFAGCNSSINYEHSNDSYNKAGMSGFKYSNEYIVVTENGDSILHHGSHETEIDFSGYKGYSSAVPILKLDCGEILATNQFVSYLNKKPNATKYDHVCHDCFPDAEIGE